MTRRAWAVLVALTLCVVGMMLVIGGVLTSGLFLPGVVLLGLGLVGWAAAAVLHVLDAGDAADAPRRTAGVSAPRDTAARA